MRIYGAVIIMKRGRKIVVEDGAIAKLVGTLFSKHQHSTSSHEWWMYAGDQGFEESNICIEHRGHSISFGGHYGLPEALRYISTLKK